MDLFNNIITVLLLSVIVLFSLYMGINSLASNYWRDGPDLTQNYDIYEKTYEHREQLEKLDEDNLSIYYFEKFPGDEKNGLKSIGFMQMWEPNKIFIRNSLYNKSSTINHEVMHHKTQPILKYAMTGFVLLMCVNILHIDNKTKSNIENIIGLSIIGLMGAGAILFGESVPEVAVFIYQFVLNPGHLDFDVYFYRNVLKMGIACIIFVITDEYKQKL